MSRTISIRETPAEVARAAAERFISYGAASIAARGRFCVVLAGGSTPKHAYELLASGEYKDKLDWSKVHVFFGDERTVPPDHADSNYRMANEAMLSRLPIPEQNVHRIRGQGDAVANARLYEDELRSYFDGAEWPRFDLVFLGMGDDGHTASLFPGSPGPAEREAWVIPNWIEKFGAYRITLTFPAINHAEQILFLVTGANKAQTLQQVLGADSDAPRFPSQSIKPINGTVEWLLDTPAAALLPDASTES